MAVMRIGGGQGRRPGRLRARLAVPGGALILALACAAPAPSGAMPIAATAGHCPDLAGGGAFEVTVRGFRAPTGLILVYLYEANQGSFMAHNQWVSRTELPVRTLDPVHLCVPAPRPGRYAISVRHDVDGNRQRTDMSDGGGFSRNPRLSFLHLRPRVEAVALTVERGVQPVDIVLNYRQGLHIGPWRH